MDETPEPQGPALKRLRAARACEMCRLKKNKCDELAPCTHCKHRKTECVYRGVNNTRSNRISPEYVHQLEEQIKALSSAMMASKSNSDAAPTHVQPPITPDGGLNDYTQSCPGNLSLARSRNTQEIGGINRHTHSFEFYGSSSSIVLLALVQSASALEDGVQHDDEEALVSSLHNPAFSPASTETSIPAAATPPSVQPASASHCRLFVDSFFATIHYIYPVLDKPAFLAKCELIWAGNGSSLSHSFVGLYYSILSLGALLRPREEEPVGGVDNVRWSRKFFEEARSRSNSGTVTDLEIVQCNFFLAKVCQNALNLHLAYLHIGLAVRIALSIGINREPPLDSNKDPDLIKAETRTWWCIYFLETEMAFSLGRPDTLGADVYHNRRYPNIAGYPQDEEIPREHLEPPQCAIIKYMVDFSRIVKAIGLNIYMSDLTLERALTVGSQIEQDIDRWVETLPPALRPLKEVARKRPLRATMEPQYIKRQRLATTTREFAGPRDLNKWVTNAGYHNLRILLFGPLLMKTSRAEHASTAQLQEKITKCLNSASLTIEIVYETFQHQEFFRTWFYNTTYTIFAASMILVYIFQAAEKSKLTALFRLVEMAIEILETMEESVVAAKAARLIQRALSRAEQKTSMSDNGEQTVPDGNPFQFNLPWSPFTMASHEQDFGLCFQLSDLGADCFLEDFNESVLP